MKCGTAKEAEERAYKRGLPAHVSMFRCLVSDTHDAFEFTTKVGEMFTLELVPGEWLVTRTPEQLDARIDEFLMAAK